MTIETEKSGNRTTISLSGELTVRSAAKLRQALDQILRSSEGIEVRFGAVSQADLSFLQILCSANITARKGGQSLTVEGDKPQIIVDLLKGAGFDNHGSLSDHQCIWDDIQAEETP